MGIKDFIRECNQREVFKRLSIYVVSSWVILQVAVSTWEPLGLPQKIVTYLIMLLLIGFPGYMLFLWKTRIKHTISAEIDEDFAETGFQRQFKKFYFSLFGLVSTLSFVAVVLIAWNNFYRSPTNLLSIPSDKIIVLDFENNTGDANFDVVGKMASDWLIHGISEFYGGEIISSKVVKEYESMSNAQIGGGNIETIIDLFNSERIITGEFFIRDNKLILNCSMQGSNGEIQKVFNSIECNSEQPLECIENLKQRVLGFLLTEEDGELSLEENPPKFDAYKTLLEAKNVRSDSKKYLELLEKSISIDTNYFEPLFLRVGHFYNLGQNEIADSLIQQISYKSGISKRQNNLLKLYRSLLNGENNMIHSYHKAEYEIVPYDLMTNSSMMVILLQFLNKPEKVEEIYEVINMQEMDLSDCYYCWNRNYAMGDAYNELNQFHKTIELLEPLVKSYDDFSFKLVLVKAYLNTGQEEKIQDFITRLELKDQAFQANNIRMVAAREHLLLNNKEKGKDYYNEIIQLNESRDWQVAQAYLFKGDYFNAELTYKQLFESNSNNAEYISRYAACLFKNGKKDEASIILQNLDKHKEKFDFGYTEYQLAVYHAITENRDEALKSLLKSIANGNFFTSGTFHNDPIFSGYLDDPIFNEILTFWH